MNYETAKEKLLTNVNSDCRQFFLKHNYKFEYGYCLFLQEDLQHAKKVLETIKNENIRAHWTLLMISMIEENIKEYPSYFEIRNFLEIDLNILLHYYKGDYFEKIIRYSDFMLSINPEVYKYIGRVLYNNKYEPQAMFFLNHSKNYFYNDPELHYLMAFIAYNNKDYNSAYTNTENCLNILPEYSLLLGHFYENHLFFFVVLILHLIYFLQVSQ